MFKLVTYILQDESIIYICPISFYLGIEFIISIYIRYHYIQYSRELMEIEINPPLVKNTGNISRESCKSGTQSVPMHEFVYKICESQGKYFLYF